MIKHRVPFLFRQSTSLATSPEAVRGQELHVLSSQLARTFRVMALVAFLLPFIAQHSSAAAPKILLSSEETRIDIQSDDWNATELFFHFGSLEAAAVKTRAGMFVDLSFPMAYSVGAPGSPKLPASKQLIEIPFGAGVRLEVTGYTIEEYSMEGLGISHPVFPVQSTRVKVEASGDIPLEYHTDLYKKSDYIEPELATLEVLGVMRGIRIARLTVAPIDYNPGQGTLRVYNNIEVTIHYDHPDKSLSGFIKASTYSPYFESLYGKVLNAKGTESTLKSFPDLLKQPIKMLIVSHPDFRQVLQPFIEWQTQKGFRVITAYTDEIGSTAGSIRQYVRNQYLAGSPGDPAPTFVLLVGDSEKLPPSVIGSASLKASDLYYGSVDGDYFPEMYYGRLSARTPKELQNQIDKTIAYQQYAFEDPSFLNNATLIAGQDFAWNQSILQPTVKYAERNYFNGEHGYEMVNAFISNYADVYSEAGVSAGVITFTGHCTATTWANPTLTASQVHDLENTGKFSLVIGNCCQSGLFSEAESIAEAWLRAENKGAVAYIGSAPDTHWYEDFYWSVGAFPMQSNNAGYVPTPEESSMGAIDALFAKEYLPVAAVKMFGNMAITRAHLQNYQTQSNILWYWQGYHTFGDPSTIIYLTEGKPNHVLHLPFVPRGRSEYLVEALPGSYVALSREGVLHGAGFVDSKGRIDLPIEPFTSDGQAMIVVTKPQHIPYMMEVPVTGIDGPLVQLDHYVINDEEGNNNQIADYGERISLHLHFKNIGIEPAESLSARLESQDTHLSVMDGAGGLAFDGIIPPGNTIMVQDAFEINVSQHVPNRHSTRLKLDITDGINNWQSSFMIQAQAPVFDISREYELVDIPGQKVSARIDPDETARLRFGFSNTGDARARNPKASLVIDSPYLTVADSQFVLPPLEPGMYSEADFSVKAHPSAPAGRAIPLQFSVEDGNKSTADTSIYIGQAPAVTIGHDDFYSTQYPFYNLYRANKTQMLYFAEEIGSGEKTISRIGFHILQATLQHNVLPNFKIRLKHTNLNQLPASFVSMADAQEVFSLGAYQMPVENGWHYWNVSDFKYDGQSNLIVEIVWGLLSDWTTPYIRVACTPLNQHLVSYGYSDQVAVPGFNGNAIARPNIHFGFSLPETPSEQPVTFILQSQQQVDPASLSLKIGSKVMSFESGSASLHLAPGQYTCHVFSAEGFLLKQETFQVANVPQTVEITLSELFKAEFHVSDTNGGPLPDAYITIGGKTHDPGVYVIPNLPPGVYPYVVSLEYFLDHSGAFEIISGNLDVHVRMTHESTGTAGNILQQEMNVFPNPARNMVNVSLSIHSPGAMVTLLNPQGMIVSRQNVDRGDGDILIQFSTAGLSPGVYFIRAESDEGVYIKKIIIQ